jgi:hypothetical protein
VYAQISNNAAASSAAVCAQRRLSYQRVFLNDPTPERSR